jgi:sporadic carbohydrate cluster 2OG-Fe(II) oxygenase
MLMDQNTKKKIYDVGWEVIDSSSIKNLELLREDIYKIIKEEFNFEEINPDIGLNNFHKTMKDITDVDLNKKKVDVIQKISSDEKLVDLIYGSFSKGIDSMLGEDLLVQKTINLVIQTPNDLNPTIPHRDAPPNSYFELVLWIPLVDCSNTKSMFTIDMSTTKNALDQLEKDPENWDNFLSKFDDKKFYPNVKFGQALFFLPYIYHGSDINKTNETRFSLNIRFKGLFTPSGKKFPLHFFRLFKTSKLTKLALQKMKEEQEK